MLYDIKLQKILLNHDIHLIDETKLNDNYEGIIIDALTKKCKNKVCALWGAGQNNTKSSHAAILITKYATFIQKMVCVIDSNSELHGKTFLGFPIIAPQQMNDYKVDIVIIASKNSGDSIKKSLHDLDPNCEYIDIYEELRNRGIEIFNNFYDENSIYSKIYEAQVQYQSVKDKNNLSKLIQYYLSIRDLYYSMYYIREYIDLKFEKYESYYLLLNEIEDLLKEMKTINDKRDQDISLFYIDALRAKDVINTENGRADLFRRYAQNGKIFTNMYSTAVTTYESMMSIIAGVYPLDAEVYQNDFMHDLNEFKLLEKYVQKGYDVHFLVADCYRIIKNDDRIRVYDQLYMSQKLWTLACTLAESQNKTFNFVYFPYETHFPLLCGYHNEKPVIKAFSDLGINEFPPNIETQYYDCLDYTNKQFDFYYDFIGINSYKVIFSDHSQVVYDSNNDNKTYNMYYKYKDLTTHVPFIISKRGWREEVFRDYYSMVDFNKIVITAIDHGNVDKYKTEIIRYQYYPMHNPKMREHAFKFGYIDYIDGMDLFLSKDYLYVQTATGLKEVYASDDLENDISETNEGKNYINIVRQKYKIAY